MTGVWLVYVDESGDLGLTAGSLAKDRWFVLGALCIEEASRPVVNDMVTRLKRQFFSVYDPDAPETEIKGATLSYFEEYVHPHDRPARNPARRFRDHAITSLSGNAVRSLRRALFDILDRVSCRLYVVAIDKQLLANRAAGPRYGPLAYAFTYISQRVFQMLEFDGARRQQGLFFLDRHSLTASERKLAELLASRETLHQRARWSPSFEPVLMHQPVILDSHLNPLIQLSDLCTYSVGRAIRRWNLDDPWFRRVEPRLARNFSTGEPWAAGLTLYPKSAYPPTVRAALRRP